jgi:hypothetical protein
MRAGESGKGVLANPAGYSHPMRCNRRLKATLRYLPEPMKFKFQNCCIIVVEIRLVFPDRDGGRKIQTEAQLNQWIQDIQRTIGIPLYLLFQSLHYCLHFFLFDTIPLRSTDWWVEIEWTLIKQVNHIFLYAWWIVQEKLTFFFLSYSPVVLFC